jgi:CheY-like chemotaxis protein
LIRAIGSIAWPLVVGFCLWRLFPKIKERFGKDDIGVEIGQLKFALTATRDATSKNLQSMQDTLRLHTAKLENLESYVKPAEVPEPLPESQTSQLSPKRILWVDDRPQNNIFEIARLRDQNFVIDEVTNTDEAIRELTRHRDRYELVVTDMGRPENEKAGIELIHRMRKSKLNTPVFVYCSPRAVKLHGEEAREAGAVGVTASPIQLLDHLTGPAYRLSPLKATEAVGTSPARTTATGGRPQARS